MAWARVKVWTVPGGRGPQAGVEVRPVLGGRGPWARVNRTRRVLKLRRPALKVRTPGAKCGVVAVDARAARPGSWAAQATVARRS
jgi:hypothetical protein